MRGEILSPAGSMDALIAAVRAGAEAVYLGADSFSARRNAHNFDRDQLKEAVRFCHQRSVRVYLALNILVTDRELPQALELAEYACSLGMDALIIQDLGLAALLRERCPDLPLHASTQMSLHTPAALPLLSQWGFSRVVPARELSVRELSDFCRAARSLGMETEVFVHGALCMSVSGQCYLSALLGGRSGNRGLCAGPCRLPFSVRGGTGHDLSLKDLCLAPHLPQLLELGVDSFKIEGRMKPPEYAAATASVYRRVRDGEPFTSKDLELLSGIFSRSGFTDGYFTGTVGRRMFGIKEADRTSPALSRSIHEVYRRERQSVPIQLAVTVHPLTPVTLTVTDGTHTLTVKGEIPHAAQSRQLEESTVREALSKWGGAPYFVSRCQAKVSKGLFFPLSQLNALRRRAGEALDEARRALHPIPFAPKPLPHRTPRTTAPAPALWGVFANTDQVPERAALNRVFLPLNTPTEQIRRMAASYRVGIHLPRGMFGAEPEILKGLIAAKSAGADAAVAGNLSAIPLIAKAGLDCIGGFSLNVMNRETSAFLAQNGCQCVTLSMELTAEAIRQWDAPCPIGIFAYGHQPLMLLRSCPVKNGDGCHSCSGAITDRKGIPFPVSCQGGSCSELYNAKVLWLADRIQEFPVDFLFLYFTQETKEEANTVIRAYRSANKGGAALPSADYTRGLSYRGVQ